MGNQECKLRLIIIEKKILWKSMEENLKHLIATSNTFLISGDFQYACLKK